jgi:hypothetical protein
MPLDPQALYVTTITSADEIVEFENRYHLEEEIECSIEKCREPHKRGYIVVLRCGYIVVLRSRERARIGRDCGKRLLGSETFEKLRTQLETRRTREALERVIGSQRFNPDGALSALEEWRAPIAEMASIRTSSRWQLEGSFLYELERAVRRHHGQLGDDGGWGVGHVVRGGQWIFISPKAGLDTAISYIKEVQAFLSKVNPSDVELRRAADQLSATRRKLQLTAECIDGFSEFCSPGNLKGLIQWITCRPPLHKAEWRPADQGGGILYLAIREPAASITIPKRHGKLDRRAIDCLG